jgi:hypothetical protein
MASPHAAGCAALLVAAGEAVTPDQIEARLETSPVKVYNPKNGLIFPRIDCTRESVPLSGVEISGPGGGFNGFKHIFSAAVSPVTATLPITYVWQATEQSPVILTGDHQVSVSFTWEITGTKTVTVSAQSVGDLVMDTHTIFILETKAKLYLPMVSK